SSIISHSSSVSTGRSSPPAIFPSVSSFSVNEEAWISISPSSSSSAPTGKYKTYDFPNCSDSNVNSTSNNCSLPFSSTTVMCSCPCSICVTSYFLKIKIALQDHHCCHLVGHFFAVFPADIG